MLYTFTVFTIETKSQEKEVHLFVLAFAIKERKEKKRKGENMKDKRREVLYLTSDLHQTLKELIRAVEELQLEIDNLLEQTEKKGD